MCTPVAVVNVPLPSGMSHEDVAARRSRRPPAGRARSAAGARPGRPRRSRLPAPRAKGVVLAEIAGRTGIRRCASRRLAMSSSSCDARPQLGARWMRSAVASSVPLLACTASSRTRCSSVPDVGQRLLRQSAGGSCDCYRVLAVLLELRARALQIRGCAWSRSGSSAGDWMRLPDATWVCVCDSRPAAPGSAAMAAACMPAVEMRVLIAASRRSRVSNIVLRDADHLRRGLVGLLVAQHVGRLLVEVDAADTHPPRPALSS